VRRRCRLRGREHACLSRDRGGQQALRRSRSHRPSRRQVQPSDLFPVGRQATATHRPLDARAASGSTQLSESRRRARDLDRAWRAGRRPCCCSVTKRATTWTIWPQRNATAIGRLGPRERVVGRRCSVAVAVVVSRLRGYQVAVIRPIPERGAAREAFGEAGLPQVTTRDPQRAAVRHGCRATRARCWGASRCRTRGGCSARGGGRWVACG